MIYFLSKCFISSLNDFISSLLLMLHIQSFEDKSDVQIDLRDDFSNNSSSVDDTSRGFRDERFAVHKVRNTPVAQSKSHSRHSSVWSSSISTGLSALFGRENCSPSSSFLPHCGGQLMASDGDIRRDNPRYSDPTTHKMNGINGPESGAWQRGSRRERAEDSSLGTISSMLWGAVARHVEKLSDTDMQLAGLI